MPDRGCARAQHSLRMLLRLCFSTLSDPDGNPVVYLVYQCRTGDEVIHNEIDGLEDRIHELGVGIGEERKNCIIWVIVTMQGFVADVATHGEQLCCRTGDFHGYPCDAIIQPSFRRSFGVQLFE